MIIVKMLVLAGGLSEESVKSREWEGWTSSSGGQLSLL
jgi:hypothetical protein